MTGSYFKETFKNLCVLEFRKRCKSKSVALKDLTFSFMLHVPNTDIGHVHEKNVHGETRYNCSSHSTSSLREEKSRAFMSVTSFTSTQESEISPNQSLSFGTRTCNQRLKYGKISMRV